VFLFGVVEHFCRSKCGQKQSVKLLQNMVYNTTQHPLPPPPHTPQPHTVFIYCTLLWEGVGGVGEAREKVERQQFIRGVENTNMTDCISSLQTILNTSKDDI
jgi:hypothetical protein